MTQTLKLFLAGILAAGVVLATVSDAQSHDMVLHRLAHTEEFAFGGVGFALATSEGEQGFRIIQERASAEKDFSYLFAHGNPQAKCYALVGLRKLNLKTFESYARTLETSKQKIAVMRGCRSFEVPAAEVVNAIRKGIYSGRLTRDSIPAPALVGTVSTPSWVPSLKVKEESWLGLLRRLF